MIRVPVPSVDVDLTKGVFGQIEAQTGVQVLIHAARLLDQIDPAGDAALSRGKKRCCLFGDKIVFVGGEDRLIESHPAKGRTGLDDLVEAAVFAFSDGDGFLRAQVVAEDFGEQLPAATNLGRETLGGFAVGPVEITRALLALLRSPGSGASPAKGLTNGMCDDANLR